MHRSWSLVEQEGVKLPELLFRCFHSRLVFIPFFQYLIPLCFTSFPPSFRLLLGHIFIGIFGTFLFLLVQSGDFLLNPDVFIVRNAYRWSLHVGSLSLRSPPPTHPDMHLAVVTWRATLRSSLGLDLGNHECDKHARLEFGAHCRTASWGTPNFCCRD